MNIASICIKRPVLSSVLSIILLLLGFVGFNLLGLREFPSVDPPTITVSTNYRGANTDVMATQITQPLEESINGIDGIRTLTSSSSDGDSRITVEFNIDANLEAASVFTITGGSQSGGNRLMTRETLSRTSLAAASKLPSILNSTVMRLSPSLLEEVKVRIPSIPLMDSSNGCVICVDITSELAPL